MKKFVFSLIFCFILSTPVFAVITAEELRSEDYIQNHGHSDETSRLINLQYAQINGTRPTYKGTDPSWYSDKKVQVIRKVFMYIDPALDDGKFMQNNIDYTPRWDDL